MVLGIVIADMEEETVILPSSIRGRHCANIMEMEYQHLSNSRKMRPSATLSTVKQYTVGDAIRIEPQQFVGKYRF